MNDSYLAVITEEGVQRELEEDSFWTEELWEEEQLSMEPFEGVHLQGIINLRKLTGKDIISTFFLWLGTIEPVFLLWGRFLSLFINCLSP